MILDIKSKSDFLVENVRDSVKHETETRGRDDILGRTEYDSVGGVSCAEASSPLHHLLCCGSLVVSVQKVRLILVKMFCEGKSMINFLIGQFHAFACKSVLNHIKIMQEIVFIIFFVDILSLLLTDVSCSCSTSATSSTSPPSSS